MKFSSVLALSIFVFVAPIAANEAPAEKAAVTFVQKCKDGISGFSTSSFNMLGKGTGANWVVAKLAQPAADGTSGRVATFFQKYGVGAERALSLFVAGAAIVGFVKAYQYAFGEEQDADTTIEEEYFFGGDDLYDVNEDEVTIE
jgi:hypothetical protein